MQGRPLQVSFRDSLRVSRGKIARSDNGGTEVHAASFLPRRLIVLDGALLDDPHELRRILIHELFHFVWWRLGNPKRREWEKILAAESRRNARGDLGWSAESRKQKLKTGDLRLRTPKWREYACESFCDTAAWYFAHSESSEYTLKPRFCARRRAWFDAILANRVLSI